MDADEDNIDVHLWLCFPVWLLILAVGRVIEASCWAQGGHS